MIRRILLLAAPAVVAAVVTGLAYSAGGPGGTMASAQAAGWNCFVHDIGGYFHCTPPGKPSVDDLLGGKTNAPTLEVRVFQMSVGNSFAGTESLIRADLYSGQPCPQDNLAEWNLLDLPVDYRACHHFDTT